MPNETGMVYVACPYSHPDPQVRIQRFEAVNRFCAGLLQQGVIIFSPISHTHPIAQYGLPKGWDYWERFDRWYIARCSYLIVLRLDGWRESVGVQAEIKMAREFGIPVEYADPAALVAAARGAGVVEAEQTKGG